MMYSTGGLVAKKRSQVRDVFDAEGVSRAHADIGLRHDREAGLDDQRERLAQVCRTTSPARRGHAARGTPLSSATCACISAISLEVGAGDVEVGAQACLGFHPVLRVRVDAVDVAVAVGEVAAGPQQLVVIVHVVDAIVLAQGLAQLLAQQLVGLVAQAEHVDAQPGEVSRRNR